MTFNFSWIQYFRRKPAKEVKMFPDTYVVKICIDHPMIVGHIGVLRVTIDAHSKEHARRQLREKLKITVGEARKV